MSLVTKVILKGQNCECGCGNKTSENKRFIWGHNKGSSKGGKAKHTNGYNLVLKHGHHQTDSKGYVMEHRLVYEEFYNCCLLKWVLIHHINGIKTDNRIENLEPTTMVKHIKHHKPKRGLRNCL